MAKTKKQEYQDANFDRLAIRIKKVLREEYRQAAEDFGLSLRELVQSGIEMYISERTGEEFSRKITPPAEKISSADKKIIDTVNSLPPESKKALLKFLDTLVSEIKPRA